jgi:hypothetical protein
MRIMIAAALVMFVGFSIGAPAPAQDLGPQITKFGDGIYVYVGKNFKSNTGICEESLYARSLRVLGRQPPAEPQCRQANLDCVRKASGSLCTRPARAKLEQRVRAMAVQRDWAAHYRLSPSLAHGRA